MSAPASTQWPTKSVPAVVPVSTAASTQSVSGKWHGQITNAPTTHSMPRTSDGDPESDSTSSHHHHDTDHKQDDHCQTGQNQRAHRVGSLEVNSWVHLL